MNTFSHVPPGFRFHPTDEELVDYYLRKKVTSRRIDLDVIKDVDLYKIEPWDLQELCRISAEEQSEWYFFSHKDKKYPTGTRTNRATAAGFWKATGRDKAIYSKHDLIGMRKTLVFYKGRAPNGQKSDWIMHEYRLETDENGTPQEEGWVVCRVFKKRITAVRKMSEHESPCWYDHDHDHDQASFLQDLTDSPKPNSQHNNLTTAYHHHHHHLPYGCKKELDHHHFHYQIPNEHFLQLPLLESSKMNIQNTTTSPIVAAAYGLDMNASTAALQSSSLSQEQNLNFFSRSLSDQQAISSVDDQVTTTDWRVLDKFVASQLSQEDNSNISAAAAAEPNSNAALLRQLNHKPELGLDNASTSTSSCQIDLWK